MKMIDREAVLAGKLAKMFPDPTVRSLVENELNQYGVEEHERERTRVQLPILKVAGPVAVGSEMV